MTIFTLENIILFFSGIVIPIIIVFINNKMERKKTNNTDKLKQELETSVIVNNKLDELINKFKADRIWITQFHNGGFYYPTGKSIQKFSIFYESVQPNIDSIRMTFQNIPVSLFSYSINEVLQKGYISIPDFKDESMLTYGLKHTANETGCKSSYIFGIYDINNRMIGTLGVEYVNRKKTLESTDIQILEVEAAQIGGIINNNLLKNYAF